METTIVYWCFKGIRNKETTIIYIYTYLYKGAKLIWGTWVYVYTCIEPLVLSLLHAVTRRGSTQDIRHFRMPDEELAGDSKT